MTNGNFQMYSQGTFKCIIENCTGLQKCGETTLLTQDDITPSHEFLRSYVNSEKNSWLKIKLRSDETHQDAMMALRDSSTSVAVSLCWGSSTRSFLIKHTVLSDTRPSLHKQNRHKDS